jgi:hypothetical protein
VTPFEYAIYVGARDEHGYDGEEVEEENEGGFYDDTMHVCIPVDRSIRYEVLVNS